MNEIPKKIIQIESWASSCFCQSGGLLICISKFPGDADAAGWEPSTWEPLYIDYLESLPMVVVHSLNYIQRFATPWALFNHKVLSSHHVEIRQQILSWVRHTKDKEVNDLPVVTQLASIPNLDVLSQVKVFSNSYIGSL